MSKFLLLLGLVSQLAVAVNEKSEINVINCQADGHHMFCQEGKWNEQEQEELEKVKKLLMQETEQYKNPSIVTIGEYEEKSIYCVLNNASSSKSAVEVVLNSPVTDCEYADILTADSNNDIQYDMVSSTIDNELEPLFNGELLPEGENTSNVCYLCEQCSRNFHTLNDLNEHKSIG